MEKNAQDSVIVAKKLAQQTLCRALETDPRLRVTLESFMDYQVLKKGDVVKSTLIAFFNAYGQGFTVFYLPRFANSCSIGGPARVQISRGNLTLAVCQRDREVGNPSLLCGKNHPLPEEMEKWLQRANSEEFWRETIDRLSTLMCPSPRPL